jgi:hypothetical protein
MHQWESKIAGTQPDGEPIKGVTFRGGQQVELDAAAGPRMKLRSIAARLVSSSNPKPREASHGGVDIVAMPALRILHQDKQGRPAQRQYPLPEMPRGVSAHSYARRSG